MNLIFLQLGIILLGSQTAFGRGLRREKRNIYIPFSTKFPDQIIPDESVCLPRISCSKTRISEYTDSSLPWTEFLTENGGSGTGYIDDTPLSGPVDLPEGVDLPDFTQFDDDLQDLDIQPVVAEVDNYLIEQAEGTCTKDRQDYCDLNNEKDFLSPEHTMCKFCGLGNKCPYFIDPVKNDLTGRVIRDSDMKELIVQLHNEVRSKIARGGCNQPKAGCMGPVVWDDELARVAQKWADQCADVDYKEDYKRQDPSLFHDPHPNRKVSSFSDWRGVGQNVARDISRGVTGKFNATSLIGHWFRQIRLFDPEGVKAFGSGNQCGTGVGYYTQLVWENTTHVGCGWSQFQYRGFPGYFENFLVCNYGPAANIWKDPVYTVANSTCDCPCVDCDQAAGMCPANPRYGSWSSWGSWGRCSRSCGGGERDRKRACTAPSEDGTVREPCPLCKGEGAQAEKCNVKKCPIWTEWTPWSDCSVSCGTGERTRHRVCGEGEEDKGACPGESIEYDECSPGPCPAWTAWTAWTGCSRSCGGGRRKRLRECGVERKADCTGPNQEEQDCNTQKCPVWTDWSDWTECTHSCGGGQRKKVRDCILPKAESAGCEGEKEVIESCNKENCPDWTPWTDWTPCTKTCGEGSKTRGRECVIPADRSGVQGCQGENLETMKCNIQSCPIWTDWSEWGSCSVSCGGGEQSRTRECVLPKDAAGCIGNPTETRACNKDICPVWTNWTDWTVCSASCGGGTRTKVRECILPDVRGAPQCPGTDKLTESCNEKSCPVLTQWGEWTECSVTCGGGKRFKRRECIDPKSGEKNDCLAELELEEECNIQPCPELGPWSDWTTCTKSCGGGTRKKVRECVQPRSVSGCVGETEDEEDCNLQDCPIWTEWTEWTDCSVTCGGGSQKRSRDCVLPDSRAFLCSGDDSEKRECNSQTCPDWTEWTDWGSCTKSCGGGTRTKLRECVLTRGLECSGESKAVESCNTQSCPMWTDWTDWTQCTKSCGGGTRTKVRECVLPKAAGECPGDASTTESCNEDKCPAWTNWSEWTECSVTCGGGSRRRTRDCVERSGDGCTGENEENEECNIQGCPGWSPWTDWTNCTAPCGGGFRERERQCLVDGVRCICEEEKLCVGNFKEGETCNEEQCPEWTSWTTWSSCSVTCGPGSQSRTRKCRGLGECSGDGEEVRDCKDRTCVSWSTWSTWSTCSSTCGSGLKERRRTCGPAVRYLDSCPGEESEQEDCSSGPCSSWKPWGSWSPCSATCGTGSRSRNRECSTDADTRSGSAVPSCVGEGEEQEMCQTKPCQGWSDWSSWSECTVSCGGGSRRRDRTCEIKNNRLGLLTSPCPGPNQDSEECNKQQCSTTTTTTTQAPSVDCGNIKVPSQFLAFNNKPAVNIADCSWDYFGCTNRYGSWPANKDCCMSRYKACCMQVMGMTPPPTTTTTTVGSIGYGPEIDIDLDINIGTIENPIDDIDLGSGTGVFRPETAALVAENEVDQKFESLSNNFISTNLDSEKYIDPADACAAAGLDLFGQLLPHPTDCTRFLSCQKADETHWIGNEMKCPDGTGFDPSLRSCNYLAYIKRCRTGRRARILQGF